MITRTITTRIAGIIVFCLLFVCYSCDDATVYDQYQSIENASWKKDVPYDFEFEVADTTALYNLTIQIRNNNLYPYQNLWLFSTEQQANGVVNRDTIECILADDYGKWYGSGISLYQISFPLRTGYRFPEAGKYSFSFRHGMRSDELMGIQDIGFKVEKVVR